MSAEPAAAAVGRLRLARGQHESTVRLLNALTPVLLVLFVLAAALAHPAPGTSGRGLVVSLCCAVFAAGVLGRNATRPLVAPLHLVAVALVAASSVVLASVQPDGPGSVCVLLAALFVARLMPVRFGAALFAVTFVVLEVVAALTDQNLGVLSGLVAFAALYGLVFLAFRLAEANREAERLLAELHASQAAQAEAAGLAERQRLAREMHDVLAHSLSGLILQLEAARMLAASDPADPRLREAVERAHRLGRGGLDEARRAIGMLRDDDLPGPDRLAELAAEFERDRAVPCRLSVDGEPYELDAQARLAVYRVTQEALTNVIRHARPEHVDIRLSYDTDRTRLVVEDVGAAPGSETGSGGYGLTGMRERAELLGGRLVAGRTGSGFRVELDVPARSA